MMGRHLYEKDVQLALKALASPIRRELLWRMSSREMQVAELSEGLAVSGPTISEHLSILRTAGLVAMRPVGTRRFYKARPEALHRFRGLFDDSAKWSTGRDHAENAHADARTLAAVVVAVDAPCSQQQAFTAFTDAARFSRWLGADVGIEAGSFSCHVHETGSVVRGTYSNIAEPAFICMDWDFDVSEVPVPGAQKRALFQIASTGPGSCRVEVTQLAGSQDEAEFLSTAWRYVLGSFVDRLDIAIGD
jgi:DNA-binding transcriptional ArsR family regulator/uncharacterized protein YndB with AHSA1/START domain